MLAQATGWATEPYSKPWLGHERHILTSLGDSSSLLCTMILKIIRGHLGMIDVCQVGYSINISG